MQTSLGTAQGQWLMATPEDPNVVANMNGAAHLMLSIWFTSLT